MGRLRGAPRGTPRASRDQRGRGPMPPGRGGHHGRRQSGLEMVTAAGTYA